ncbi:MAG: cytochrome c oxidase assembly factor CtaG [Ktedonobacterales bacterium]
MLFLTDSGQRQSVYGVGERAVPTGLDVGWNWDPAVLLGIASLCAAYYWLVGPFRKRRGLGEPATRRQIAYFVAGVVTLALTLITPLDALGRHDLFSAHMLQLMLLNTLIGPLLLLSLPEWLVRAAVRPLARPGSDVALLMPVLAGLVFNATFLLWHSAPLYEPALRNEAPHDLETATLLLTGTFRWWPLLTPADHRIRMASPGQIVYLLLESLPLDIFAVVLIFATNPLYPTYAAAPRLWGISAMLDQEIAGCIALVPGTFLDIILMSTIFFAWLRHVERNQEQEDERLAALQQGGQHTP